MHTTIKEGSFAAFPHHVRAAGGALRCRHELGLTPVSCAMTPERLTNVLSNKSNANERVVYNWCFIPPWCPAPPSTPAVCQEHHHGTVGQALIPRREASPRSPDVRSNHCASLMKPVITVWAIWAKNKETQHTRERRGRAGVERLAAASGNLPKWNWQQDRNWRGGECVFVPLLVQGTDTEPHNTIYTTKQE